MVKIPVTIFSAIIVTIILLVSVISLSSVLAQEDVKPPRLSPSQANMATETVSEGQTEDTVSKTTDSDTNDKTENEVVKSQEAPPTQRSLDSASVSSSDKTPPEKVGTLSIKAISSSEIKLKWSASKASDLNHYNVYRVPNQASK